jgi:hypothetical protein
MPNADPDPKYCCRPRHFKNIPIFCLSPYREKRLGNNLYQELSFQDTDALGDVDEGADLTGNGKPQK